MQMTTKQLHKLMSITDEAIIKLKQENYSAGILLQKKFERIQDELYGKPIG